MHVHDIIEDSVIVYIIDVMRTCRIYRDLRGGNVYDIRLTVFWRDIYGRIKAQEAHSELPELLILESGIAVDENLL
jgi:hypothetical protein